MTVYLTYGGEDKLLQVASNVGWADFMAWAEAELDLEPYKQIHHLLAHGWSQSIRDLAAQLRGALREHPPDGESAAEVGKAVLDAVMGLPGGAQSVFTTDGYVRENSEEDRRLSALEAAASGPITRAVVHAAHVKSLRARRQSVFLAARAHLMDVYHEAADGLRGAGGPLAGEDSRAAARRIAARVCDVRAWRKSLIETLAPAWTEAFAEGALAEARNHERAKSGWFRVSSAADYLKAETLTLQPQLGEYPPWLRKRIKESLRSAFKRPYWLKIHKTTREQVRREIQRGLDDGESLRDVALELEDISPTISASRGMAIARTESLSAVNSGHVAGILQLQEESGEAMGKEWLSVFGSTSRADHMEASGQVVGVEDDFALGEENCPYPGYEGLSAGQRINCQCAVLSAFMAQELEAASVADLGLKLGGATHGDGGA